MNKQRRQDLEEALNILDDAIDAIQVVCDEETEAFDSLPEGLQCGSRGDQMQDAIDTMEDGIAKMQNIKDRLLTKLCKK